MPATIQLSALPAKASNYGGVSVIFDLTGKPAPVPPRLVTVKTTAEALAALEEYKAEAQATGLPLAVSMRLKEGRAPNGFKAATDKLFYHRINV